MCTREKLARAGKNSINIIVAVHMQNAELFQSQGDNCHDVNVLMRNYQYL
jgi:hypothetical protein